MRKKLAIVIPRFGKNILGGAERYTFQLAQILSQKYEVHILTTTASDHMTWEEEYSAGKYEEDNWVVHRFKIDRARTKYWDELQNLLIETPPTHWSHKLGEEWLVHQGPISQGLLDHLQTQKYDKYIFVGYLYAPIYFGLECVDRSKVWLLPTYHDELPFYLSIFEKYRFFRHLFLTNAEKELAQRRFGEEIEGEIIGFGIEDRWNEETNDENYVLYAGRLESSKGVASLIKFHQKFFEKYDIPLYLIGQGSLSENLPQGVEYKGFVSEEEKFRYMQKALAFIHPSAYESLGIVLLEAFMVHTPALVNARSEVLSDHIRQSEGGMCFISQEEYTKNLLQVIDNRQRYGYNARRYYEKHFSYDVFRNRVLNLI